MTADVSPSVRRQVYELTASDLENFPVWEFALDEEGVEGQDEATVRPYLVNKVDPADGMQVVRAKFVLADRTIASGFVSPPPPSGEWDIRNFRPSIVTGGGHVPFYFGMRQPSAEVVAALLGTLGKSAQEIFPLEFETDMEIVGGQIKGTISGFSFLKGGLGAGVIETVEI
jgi:hypothetical protein